ncbi:lysophospholipid acyltransferase family protein [Puniceicoccales bacterium CK1056]|uniref:Lysophospholipid acyltransferase family protein n=1 Tax=Oceanipulchritudo coccoides TaxID=2706888 RepID=A0A6B2M388_9BACT|nr:lysophospholipid acyltransferase family protein [Oceanipulchritudo coccoides]NDV62564.1 lysophospholipid acyltransferase family protein [Oceanipulchritudo coccoides]
MNPSQAKVIDFRELSSNRLVRAFLGCAQWILEPLLRTHKTNVTYRKLLELRKEDPAISFYDHGLEALGVVYDISEKDLSRIPSEGPVFLLANHPYGGVDGLVLGSLLDRIRPDSRLLANSLLDRIDHMGGRCFYVNPFGTPDATRGNFKGLKQTLKWLREGHAMATFPSGTVSHLKWGSKRVTDPLWAENLVPIILKTGATIVPVYFPGRNSDIFQLAGLIHPFLRTLMLPREMVNAAQRRVEVRIGNPISAKRLQHFGNNREVMDFLRLRTYILQNREVAKKTKFTSDARKAHSGEPIVDPQPPELLIQEIESLKKSALLLEHGPFAVYAAQANDIPNILLEIGRLREITFRAVGEGTGTPRDLDKFDDDYWHLFVWNREEYELLGAYRLGLTNEILPVKGKRGLYTSTLFRFKTKLIQSLDPAIELGRSFVVEKYQRKPLSLGLLWKGIGQFVVQHPDHCHLFGPVSISNDYKGLSKNLMVTYLREHALDPVLASKVKARHPTRSRNLGSLDRRSFKRSVRDIEDVSALISEIEREERGVPVLLRQYLKLNATMLSFNVDPAFNDSLDGLILIDLRRTSMKTLERYMGKDGAERFYEHHRQSISSLP